MPNEYRDMSAAAKRKYRQRMERNMIVAVAVLAGISKLYVPVDTGNLRDSVEGNPVGLSGTIGTPVEYAPYVEFGTGVFNENITSRSFSRSGAVSGGMKPQPFLRPLLDMHQDDFLRIMKK